ncbi:MAG: isoprenyl transferase [Lachnospiraceae bacterium]|nr:isoprenyl transferase [Candidatus Merdinaster equi]
MNIPRHVAIILDGNGRWAKAKGMPRTYGHYQGAKNVETICQAADDLGIKYVTMYAFSTENWKRPEGEVDEIMKLLRQYLAKCLRLSKKHNMRIRVIGDITGLDKEFQDEIVDAMEKTSVYTGLNLTIALNYGSRDEIRRAVQKIATEVKNGELSVSEITEEVISAHLDTADIPDPDLMIRTSGEQRLSNYLMWQHAYSEFYFTSVPWPDFDEKELLKAVEAYSDRDRRYGKV